MINNNNSLKNLSPSDFIEYMQNKYMQSIKSDQTDQMISHDILQYCSSLHNKGDISKRFEIDFREFLISNIVLK